VFDLTPTPSKHLLFVVQNYQFFQTPLPILTAFYRILPKLTDSYCILPLFTDSYRLGGRLPFVERQTDGKRTANERISAKEGSGTSRWKKSVVRHNKRLPFAL
jgi:hypothetical protein